MTEPLDDARGELADKLERLCCAETEGRFFDLVTDSIGTILAALRPAPVPQCEAEPVAWRWKPRGNKHWIYDPEDAWREDNKDDPAIEWQPLYATPPSRSDEGSGGLRRALEKVAQRANEGLGDITSLQNTIHEMHAIARAALFPDPGTVAVAAAQYRCTCGAEPYCAPNVHDASCPLAISSTTFETGGQ